MLRREQRSDDCAEIRARGIDEVAEAIEARQDPVKQGQQLGQYGVVAVGDGRHAHGAQAVMGLVQLVRDGRYQQTVSVSIEAVRLKQQQHTGKLADAALYGVIKRANLR